MVKVMAVNAGSSSLKFQLINMPSEEVITLGLVERIGQEVGNFVIKVNGEKIQTQTPIPDHQVAVELLLNALVDHHIVESLEVIDAVGHRVVHGGEDFDDSVVVDEEAVKKVATQLGIEEVLNKYPYQMSGGQKQRVASARALVTNPELILADEPTGALDSKSAKMLLERFSHLNKYYKATILMVTHDSFTASYCDRILFIKDGKIFTELVRGTNTRRQFFNKILDVVALLGGDVRDVRSASQN